MVIYRFQNCSTFEFQNAYKRYDRVFDTLITSLALFFDYNVILRGQQRDSHFLRLLGMYLVFTYPGNLQLLSCKRRRIYDCLCALFTFESRIDFTKKVRAKNAINAISLDVKYLI